MLYGNFSCAAMSAGVLVGCWVIWIFAANAWFLTIQPNPHEDVFPEIPRSTTTVSHQLLLQWPAEFWCKEWSQTMEPWARLTSQDAATPHAHIASDTICGQRANVEDRLRDAVINLVAWIENHGVCSGISNLLWHFLIAEIPKTSPHTILRSLRLCGLCKIWVR